MFVFASPAAHNLRAFYQTYDQANKLDLRSVCYEAVVYTTDDSFLLGKIITPLKLEDWCELHRYKKVEVRGLPRPARQGEITDLK